MLKIFFIFFKVGLFTFGGGYAMVPIIETEIVKKIKIVTNDEFYDYLSVAQSFPGPVAVNLSVLLGYRINGFLGAIISLFGTVLPSFIVIILISIFYSKSRNSKLLSDFFEGIIPVVPALLLYSFYSVLKKTNHIPFNYFLIVICFILVALLNINPLYIIIGGVCIGICKNYFYSS